MCISINRMRPRIRLGITWSLEELKLLVKDENSCVVVERCRKHVALQPIHLSDLNKAFQDILDSSINVYDHEFKGLLLAYKNPKLVSQLGSILYDSYFIHVNIEADFYIFKPEKERVLSGVVNKKANNYVGVLVHKVFNVSIPKKEDEENWEGHNLNVGDDITFTIEYVDLKGKLPYIRGEILSNGTASRHISSTASSHTFFNSDEELNDSSENFLNTVHKNKKAKKSKCPSFLNSTNSNSSDEEPQTDNKVVKAKKCSKSREKSISDEENIYEEQSSNLENTTTTGNEDEISPVEFNGIEKSEKLPKKDKKKKSKNKDRHIENEYDTSCADSMLNQSEDTSLMDTTITTKKSKKRKHVNEEESSFSEPPQKVRKQKKKNTVSEGDEQNYISNGGENLFSESNEMERPTMLVENETTRKSKKKRKEKIKVEENNEQVDCNEMEINSTAFNSDIDLSRNSSQEEQPSTSPKKSKHKNKSKQKIKQEEQTDSPIYSDGPEEYSQTLNTEYETNRTTESIRSEENQTDVSSHNCSSNEKDVPQQNFNEFEVPTKPAKKKKRSKSGSEIFSAVKIKQEPVSDTEGSSGKKSKRKQKNRDYIDDSFNNLGTETLDTNSSPGKKKKDNDEEPVNDASIGKITMKEEIVVKEEGKKKKHKADNESNSNIKQESTFSDVDGTAVKKKIKILFTE